MGCKMVTVVTCAICATAQPLRITGSAMAVLEICISGQPPGTLPGGESLESLVTEMEKLAEQGNYPAAALLADQARRQVGRLAPNDVRAGIALGPIGHTYQLQGRYREAEKAYQQALRLLDGEESHRALFIEVLHNLGSLYFERYHRYAEAERLIQRALDLAIALLGGDHPYVGAILGGLATVDMMQGHNTEALDRYARALRVLEKSPLTHGPGIARVLSNLGYLSMTQRQHQDALLYLTRSVALYEQSLGPNHPELIVPLANLGRVYLASGQPEKAEEPLRRAAGIAESAFGPDNRRVGEVLSSYSDVLRKTGRKKQAREMEARARSINSAANMEMSLTVSMAELISQSRKK